MWNWLIGRKFSLGKVISIFEDTAVVLRGDKEYRILISELLEEEFKSLDRYEQSMNWALNSGDGSYIP